MRLRANMTIEASFIFSFIGMLVAAFIMLDFKLYDGILNDSVKILGGLRYHAAETYYYDCATDKIDYAQRASSPVLSGNKTFMAAQKIKISKILNTAYGNGRLNNNDSMSGSDFTSVIKSVDNAGLVRAGGRVVQIIGGKNGD